MFVCIRRSRYLHCSTNRTKKSSEDRFQCTRTTGQRTARERTTGFAGVIVENNGLLEAQLAVGRVDIHGAVNFSRLDRQAYLPRGRGYRKQPDKYFVQHPDFDGQFDSGSTAVAAGAFAVGDEHWQYGFGSQSTHGTALGVASANHTYDARYNPAHLSGLQRLVLRRNGFLSLSTLGMTPGWARTVPMLLPSCAWKLVLNVETAITGVLNVRAIAPPTANRHPGQQQQQPRTASAESYAITANAVALSVQWRKGAEEIRGAKQLVLEFNLTNANLYSFQFACNDATPLDRRGTSTADPALKIDDESFGVHFHTPYEVGASGVTLFDTVGQLTEVGQGSLKTDDGTLEKRITCGGGYGWSVSARACPPPQWEPRWAMNLSTVTESAANISGFYDAEKASQWGVITMDWQDGAALWQDALPGHTGEEVLAEQCKRIKAHGTGTRCMVYRQNELAVQWQESSRAAMTQANVDAGWFLKFKTRALCESAADCDDAAYHNKNGGGPLIPCKKPATLSEPNCAYCCNFTKHNSTGVYNEPLGGPWQGHGPYNTTRFGHNALGDAQLFWDFRNPDVQEWVAEKVLINATSSEYVDGLFVDDPAGYGQEHPAIQSVVQLTPVEVAALQLGTQEAWLKTLGTLLPRKKYIMQAYSNVAFPSGATPVACASWMRQQCAVLANESTSIFVVGHDVNMSVAAFLVARGPFSLITMSKAVIEGRNWSDPEYRSYRLDTGAPTGGCVEAPTSVFSRSWTKGRAAVDCATGTATLDFGLLPRGESTISPAGALKTDDAEAPVGYVVVGIDRQLGPACLNSNQRFDGGYMYDAGTTEQLETAVYSKQPTASNDTEMPEIHLWFSAGLYGWTMSGTVYNSGYWSSCLVHCTLGCVPTLGPDRVQNWSTYAVRNDVASIHKLRSLPNVTVTAIVPAPPPPQHQCSVRPETGGCNVCAECCTSWYVTVEQAECDGVRGRYIYMCVISCEEFWYHITHITTS